MERGAWVRRKIEQLFWLIAVLLPAFSAMSRAAVESSWSDDMATVRGLGLVAVGSPATITTVILQAASLIPIGPLTFRMAIASSIALGLCAALIHRVCRTLLDAHVPDFFLNAPLAAIAALTATLGPAMQREATVGAGSVIAAGLALIALTTFVSLNLSKTTRWPILGLSCAALVCENPPLAGVSVLAAACFATLSADVPGRRAAAASAALFIVGISVFALPVLVRPVAPHVWLNIGHSLTSHGMAVIDSQSRPTTALSAWRSDVGIVSVALGVVGCLVGLLRRRTRPSIALFALLIAADVAFPATTGAVLTTDPLTPVRLLAIASVSALAAFGVQSVAATLIDMALPMARAAAVLLLMFNLTLVAVTAEQSAFSIDRSSHRGASVFVDEGLEKIEPESMVLVRSQAVAWRLLSARIVGGVRPDVLVIPIPMLHRPQFATALLAVEPATDLLLRDIAIFGNPGEHAVSNLADRRSLYVEFDPHWDARVANHLVPDGLWLRLNPQPQSSTDRKLAIAAAQRPFDKMAASVRIAGEIDRASAAVLLASARQQAVASAVVSDRKSLRSLLDRILSFDPDDLFVRDMVQRLEHSKGNTIDVQGLLP